jgi:heme a synthase
VSSAARFARATLCFNVAVVLWGAFVRATGSGAGCANKWPGCGGSVLGTSANAQAIIEFTHRMTSGVALLMVAILLLWCWRATSKGNWARHSAVLATAFLANEALLGAALVLLGHVAQDQSAGRILFLCLHFGNTLLLLATLALTAAWLRGGSENFILTQNRTEVSAVFVGLLAVLANGMTGTVAALGDTLFPATSLRVSVLQDFTSDSPALLHFRLLHPVLAVIAGTYVIWLVLKNSSRRKCQSRASVALIILLFTEIGIGLLNVLLLAPVWLQILHLLVADTLWISLVLASAALVLEHPYARWRVT